MKNIQFWSVLAILILGIACLRFSYTRGSIENWAPVHLPFPGAGLVVASSFHIESGGKFDLSLSIPMSGEILGGIPPQPPVNSMLKVTIIGEKKFEDIQHIKKFQHSGGGGFSRTYFYSGSIIKLPRKGNYKIEIANEDNDEIFENCSKTGGMIRLVRYEKLETGLLYGLLHMLSYIIIAISIVGMMIIGISMHFKKSISKNDFTKKAGLL